MWGFIRFRTRQVRSRQEPWHMIEDVGEGLHWGLGIRIDSDARPETLGCLAFSTLHLSHDMQPTTFRGDASLSKK